ncbi:MAG: TolC family protein [Bacteroidia bacterium]|nr:TolC family protein [Bacteroidia bacterium]
MKNKLLLFLLSFLALQTKAQENLGFQAFLERVKSNHPLFQKANNVGEMGRLAKRSAQGGFDPFLSGDFDNKTFDGKNYYSVLNLQVKQPLFASQYLSAGYGFSQGVYLNPEEKTPAAGLPFIGVETALGQGMFIDKRRAELLKAKGYEKYYDAEKNRLQNELLYQASVAYFDWIFTLKELSLSTYFLDLADKRFQGIKSLAEIGENAAIDSVEAFILLQSRLLQVQSVKMDLNKVENFLLAQNWLAPNQEFSMRGTLAVEDSLEQTYNWMKTKYLQLLAAGPQVNPEISKYQAYQQVLEVEKKFRAEMIKPKLDVKYNFLGNSPSSNALFNTSNYKWGVQFAMPLLLRSARNDYKIAKLNLQNNALDLTTKRNELDLKLEVIQKNLNILSQQLSNAEQNARLSKQLLSAEKMKFDSGESSLFLLNTRETRWMDAELKLAEYRAKFIKGVMELIYVRGDLGY